MARTSRSRRKNQGFLPESARVFLKERRTDGLAFFYTGLGLFITIALLSYSTGDAAWNTASSTPIRNGLGSTGAMVADVLIQTFGLGSGLLVFTLISWGIRLYRDRYISAFLYRFISLPLMMVLAAPAFECLPLLKAWPVTSGFGGIVGHMIMNTLAPLLHLPGIWSQVVLGIAFGIVATGFFLLASALNRQEWLGIGRTLAMLLQTLIKALQMIHNTVRGFFGFMGLELSAFSRSVLATRSQSEDEEDRGPQLSYNPPALDDDEDQAGPQLGMEQSLESEPRLNLKAAANQTSREFISIDRKKTDSAASKSKARKQLSLSFGEFELPSLDILTPAPAAGNVTINQDALRQNAQLLESVLNDFGVEGKIIKVRPGPVVTLYELEPAPGIKSSRVIGLADDIARSMSAVSVRVAVVPGRNVIGIELPNKKRETVFLRDLLEAEEYEKNGGSLPLVLGKDIGGLPVVADLAKMPHLLIAGTTGSGKSVGINTMILSLLYRLNPSECRFIMIDPKMLELSVYDEIPHLLAPVVTDPKKAVVALKWAVKEMESRYRAMSKVGVRNIHGYNQRVKDSKMKGESLKRRVQTGFDEETGRPIFEDQDLELKVLPLIVVVVDEMADLMMVAGKDIEGAIQRLAQMARAAGIHIIMATQRPSVDVITGTIKANFPTRISFQVTSKIDSRTILGEQGAETLLGQGDMLYMAGGGRITRVHGPFVSDKEVEDVVKHLKSQARPEYDEQVTAGEDEGGDGSGLTFDEGGDELYQQAIQIVLNEKKASTSFIQRRLQIGYNRAARMIEKMEQDGIISPANATGRREVIHG